VGNDLLRARREALPSRLRSEEPMSRAELAEAVNAHVWVTTGQRTTLDAHAIARYERGHSRWPGKQYRDSLRAVLGVETDAEIGFYTTKRGTAARDVGRLSTWDMDTLTGLTDLGSKFVDLTRRGLLGVAAYSAVATALPSDSWWSEMARRSAQRAAHGVRSVGRGDIEAVRESVTFFSRMDQRHGGGHARAAAMQYLTDDVNRLLNGSFASDTLRREMFSAASELAYIAGWMAFDNAEHGIAQGLFTSSVKLAAEAEDPAMAAHTLRAMAHQAIDLGHPAQGQELAAASVNGDRYEAAAPRERALLGVVHARALAATGQKRAATSALLRAEQDLASAAPGGDEPARVFFFGEASLAHETGNTLRDIGDLAGAEEQLEHSVATRKKTRFKRTHAVTLGYLGDVQARRGELELACTTWSTALDAMDGVQSARARQTIIEMRSALAIHKATDSDVAILDERARAYLAATN
jgi:transcriptional regulator with XRE-family HTH domain